MAYEEWEFDNGHNGVIAWLAAWRARVGELAPRPAYTFAEHLGRAVSSLATDGVPKAELARICSAAGYDGVCPCCGETPDGLVTARAAEIVDRGALTRVRYGV